MSRKGTIYGVYDTKDNERCIGIMNMNQLVEFTHKPREYLYVIVSQRNLLQKRYLIEKVDDE